MKLLLDTHVAIWALGSPKRIPHNIARLLLDPRSEVFLSAISIFEVALKRDRPRRTVPDVSAVDFRLLAEQAGYVSLPVTSAHAEAVADLPLLHNDPYDRLIVAQALSEPLRLVTHDERLAGYSDTIIVF